jgi:hypothetical protein
MLTEELRCLGLPARKAIDDENDHDDEHGKTGRPVNPLVDPFLPVIKTKGPRHDGGS